MKKVMKHMDYFAIGLGVIGGTAVLIYILIKFIAFLICSKFLQVLIALVIFGILCYKLGKYLDNL